MPEYKFDSKRWCMSMSKVHSANGQFDVASTLRTVAEEIDTLRAQLAESERRRVELVEATVHIYNSGYSAGHHYTVEGGYVDIHSSDMDTYHAEEVAGLLASLVGEEGK